MIDRVDARSSESLRGNTEMNAAVQEAYSDGSYQSVFTQKAAGENRSSSIDFGADDIYVASSRPEWMDYTGQRNPTPPSNEQQPISDGTNRPPRNGIGPRVASDIYSSPPPEFENNSNNYRDMDRDADGLNPEPDFSELGTGRWVEGFHEGAEQVASGTSGGTPEIDWGSLSGV